MTMRARQAVFISGFRQPLRVGNGMDQMADAAIDHGGAYVRDMDWHEDMASLAARMARQRVERVMIVGYSWGAGRGSVDLARALQDEEIDVDRMVLIDPVRFVEWLPWWMQPTAMSRWTRSLLPIRVPPNVKRLGVLRQTNNRPMGFPVRVRPSTELLFDDDLSLPRLPDSRLYVGHEDMHWLPRVKEIVAEQFVAFVNN